MPLARLYLVKTCSTRNKSRTSARSLQQGMHMRYFHKNREFLKEHLARLIATLILLSMGCCALHVCRWLLVFFR